MSRPALAPLALLYRGGLAAKNFAYDYGLIEPKRLHSPVVSIGNLSVGGSGKTPLTIRLAELLLAKGLAVDVLSRGHGRSSQATERVDPLGSAERFGDEPLLIALRTRVPVFVGASRYQAGLLAEAGSAAEGGKSGSRRPHVHLLDDGFQHRQLALNVNIVVLHRSDFTEMLLPAGRLREPLSALRRADFLALREDDEELEPKLRQMRVTAPIWWLRRSLLVPAELAASERPVAFCGIARPKEFSAALKASGCAPIRTFAFADHHRYSAAEVKKLARAAAGLRADALVTTEKDAVRLTAGLRQLLEQTAPLRVAPLALSVLDEATVLRQLLEKLPRPTP
jgi:tetraacyldisaccharide 4'-kinase